jgi:sugar phosphate isomerase/epimerase
MRLGIQPDIRHKVREAFEFASSNNFNHVEILMDHPFYSRENLSYTEILELKGCYDLDVLIHAPSMSTNFLSVNSAMRRMSYEELEKTVYFADRCEAEVVTFHIGWNPGFITSKGFIFQKEIFDEHNLKVIKSEMYPFLKTYDSIVSLENTIDIEDSLSNAIKFLIDNTDVNLTFDIGHYNIKKGHEIFLENFDKVVNVHLHDNNGRDDSHLALGNGVVDLNIIPKSYDGFFTLEVRDENAIFESQKYLENMNLKTKLNGCVKGE